MWAEILEWILAHPVWFVIIMLGSTIAVSAIVIPIQVTRMAPDYFLENRDSEDRLQAKHPIARFLGLVIKNVVGGILVLAGILLSLPGVPGQGLLTILIGLMIMDFPGKKKLELQLFRIERVRRGVDWIRQRKGKAKLILPEPGDS